MKSTILAEDKDILVCYKPPGIAVQSARLGEPDMVSELKNYLGGKNPYLGVVHDWISLFQETLFLPKRRLRQQP